MITPELINKIRQSLLPNLVMITPSIQRSDWLHKPTVGPLKHALKKCRNLLYCALSTLHSATGLTSCGIPTITSLMQPCGKSIQRFVSLVARPSNDSSSTLSEKQEAARAYRRSRSRGRVVAQSQSGGRAAAVGWSRSRSRVVAQSYRSRIAVVSQSYGHITRS